jgi:hypothetical protein
MCVRVDEECDCIICADIHGCVFSDVKIQRVESTHKNKTNLGEHQLKADLRPTVVEVRLIQSLNLRKKFNNHPSYVHIIK